MPTLSESLFLFFYKNSEIMSCTKCYKYSIYAKFFCTQKPTYANIVKIDCAGTTSSYTELVFRFSQR